MKKFTLYLGLHDRDNKALNLEAVRDFIDSSLFGSAIDGYTLTKAQGYWKGLPEPSLLITAIRSTIYEVETKEVLTKLAETYKNNFNQDSVLLTVQDIEATFI